MAMIDLQTTIWSKPLILEKSESGERLLVWGTQELVEAKTGIQVIFLKILFIYF